MKRTKQAAPRSCVYAGKDNPEKGLVYGMTGESVELKERNYPNKMCFFPHGGVYLSSIRFWLEYPSIVVDRKDLYFGPPAPMVFKTN